MSKQERVAVFIDGSNLHGYLKDLRADLPVGKRLEHDRLVSSLVRDRDCVSKRYYVGIVRNYDNSAKSQAMVQAQQRFLAHLQKAGFAIKRGRILYEGQIREKGTDVRIAVDLVVGAIDNQFDTAILVSSDTDLTPAIKYLKYKGKKLEYVGFQHASSYHLQQLASSSTLLTSQDVSRLMVQTG